MTGKYNVGIIGCGLIGGKRANALKDFKNSKLILAADIDIKRAKEFGKEHCCDFTDDWRKITRNKDLNIVVVATTNDMLAEITTDAIKHGKHVLVEKPAARNPKELMKVINAAKKNRKVKVKVGFNHRFHPAIQKAKELITTEGIGEVMFIRARYGHGGRIGYDTEWRAVKKIAGGGEMLDQGSHIIDLSRYFMGDFKSAIGKCKTYFWDMEVEDNCFALLETKKGQIAQLHASCTQWKNIFSMEIFCRTGQINIDGLGRSYGVETLTYYKMKPEMGPPITTVQKWDEPDKSWEKEYQNLIEAIEKNMEPDGNLYDAFESIKIIEKIYREL
ncbi:MAG: Gfo/Idh/MocA family oxidoreductase [Candidatus Altiarchaeota archaeon]|nr:Gfo/Idh/MocA family oxidoreductase [Candidatus Altiarchaeota archaeon]